MKVKRVVALGAIALLAIGAMGAIASQSFAMGLHDTAGVQAHTSVAQAHAPVVQSQTCAQDQTDGTEVSSTGADTDNVDLQCGDQSAPDAQETVGAADSDNVDQQVGDQSGDQSGPDTGVQAPESGN